VNHRVEATKQFIDAMRRSLLHLLAQGSSSLSEPQQQQVTRHKFTQHVTVFVIVEDFLATTSVFSHQGIG
jgi:hypothetical protein